MLILSYWLFPVLLFTTLHIQRIQNDFYRLKYFNSTLLSVVGTIFLSLIYFEKIDWHSLRFLFDYKFYLSQIISIAFMILQVKSRKANEHNLTICYFVNFLSIAIVPFVSIGLMKLFEFKNTIEVKYDNPYDVILLSISLFVLSIFFYLDKLKNKSINNIGLLVLVFFFGAVSGVFASKMMQEYNPVTYMTVATAFNGLVFFILFSAKEKFNTKVVVNTLKEHKKNYLFLCLGYCVTLYLNIIIISNLPTEYYSIIRNVGIILVNYIYAYYYQNINLFNMKDSIILGLIIITLVHFTT